MLAGIAHQALEPHRQFKNSPHHVVFFVQGTQFFFLLERFLERHAEFLRDQLGDPVDERERMTQHAADVTHDRLGSHRAVGDDLRDVIATIFIRDIFDDPVTSLHTEIDIEVGHRNALGIEKAFEQKFVAKRIQVGNAERPGYDRTCPRASPRSDWHIVLSSPANEIGDNQEISGKPHPRDDIEFLREPRLIGIRRVTTGQRRHRTETQIQTAACLRGKVTVSSHTLRDMEFRKRARAESQVQRATSRDLDTVLKGLGQVGEQRCHLIRRLQILFFRVRPLPAGIGQHLSPVDADTSVECCEVLTVHESHIVGGYDRTTGGNRYLDGALVMRRLTALTDAL